MGARPPQSRSRAGCWTCRRRRVKCDEGKPKCEVCTKSSFECEGYGVRLEWDVGVASRGRLRGAQEPVPPPVPQPSTGRQRQRVGQKAQPQDTKPPRPGPSDAPTAGNGPASSAPPPPIYSPREQELLHDFATKGYLELCSGNPESPIATMVQLVLARASQIPALGRLCMALQIYILSPESEINEEFMKYYELALGDFRQDLSDPIRRLDNATLGSAVVLCSMGLLTGMDWTMHLIGVISILDSISGTPSTPVRGYLTNVAGFLDLGHFVLGRKTPQLNLWSRYFRAATGENQVEQTAPIGWMRLPYTMLDLFARMFDDDAETLFLEWPGQPGQPLQCQLWDAYRYAGILDSRRLRYGHEGKDLAGGMPQSQLVQLLVGSLEAVHLSYSQPDSSKLVVVNALVYPVVMAFLEIKPYDEYEQWHATVEGWWDQLKEKYKCRGTANISLLLQEYCSRTKAGEIVTVDEIAREMDLEIGLF